MQHKSYKLMPKKLNLQKGEEMKFYFDHNITKIDVPEEEKIIFYSSYSHNLLKVNLLAASIFDYIIKKGPGQEISCEEAANTIPELDSSDIQEVFTSLSNSGLFFDTPGAYYASCFESQFQAELKFNIKQVYFHLTYHCNLACEYCYNKEKLNRTTQMSLEEWKQVIDDLKSISNPQIHLTGGEPTLYEDFDDIVDYIHASGLSIGLLTNGTMLHKIKEETLKKVDAITISLDSIGNAKTHRKNSQKYDILGNIFMVHDKGIKTTVRSVVSKDTEQEVRELKKHLSQYKINHISSIYIPNTPEEICNVPQNIDPDSFHESTNLLEVKRCGACFETLAIDPAGTVYPCQSLMKDDLVLGNVKESDWLTAVKNHNLTKYFLYRTIERIDGCRDCEMKTICGGGCPAIAYDIYHSLEHKLDYFCNFLKNESKCYIKHIEFQEGR